MKIEMVYKKLLSGLQDTLNQEDKNYYVGAVCLDKRYNIVSTGYNSYIKTHPEQKKYAQKNGKQFSCFLHAEIAALVKARSHVDSVMVMRIIQNGEIKMAKPCKICEMALKEARVKQVWYTNDEGVLCSYYLGRIE